MPSLSDDHLRSDYVDLKTKVEEQQRIIEEQNEMLDEAQELMQQLKVEIHFFCHVTEGQGVSPGAAGAGAQGSARL